MVELGSTKNDAPAHWGLLKDVYSTVFLSPSFRLNIHHRDGMRQPDMAFILCQESNHLPEAGGGCSGTPYR
jgi:hypothetical protein